MATTLIIYAKEYKGSEYKNKGETTMQKTDIFSKLNKITGITKYSSSEIITPTKAVNDMVDLIPRNTFVKTTKFIDPAVKSGRYLIEIYRRLMDSEQMAQEFPDEADRSNWILRNQLYGLATSSTSATISRKALYNEAKVVGNIRYIPNYTRAIIDGINFKSLIEREFGVGMKFDVVIGNPPYQEDTGTKQGGAISIYDQFILKSAALKPRFISMIIPIKWYAGNKRLDKFRSWMIDTNKVRVLHDFKNTSDIFGDTVYLGGGICYFLWDLQYNGKCDVIQHLEDGTTSKTVRYLKHPSGVMIRDNLAISILDKIGEAEPLSNYVSATVPFGIPTNDKGSIIPNSETDVQILVTGNDIKGGTANWYPINGITKGRELIDKHKLYITTGGDNMLKKPYYVYHKPMYGPPRTICNGSYLVAGPFKHKEECENVWTYLCSKFVRFLVQQCKADQHVYASTFKCVPFQDFTHPWTDQMLYAKYNLTQEEINYIEKTIKPIE